MYARILLVGSYPHGEASTMARLRAVMADGGHATATIIPNAEGAVCTEELASFLQAFRPSLVVWDASSAPWELNVNCSYLVRASGVYCSCINASCPNMRAFGIESGADNRAADATLMPTANPLEPCRDERYLSATTSSPSDQDRKNTVLVCQKRTHHREEAIQALHQAGVRVVSWNRSWESEYCNPSLSAGAFDARHCSVCACFDGDDALTPQEVVLRMHEGCALVVEEALASRWDSEGYSDLAHACERTPLDGMEDACLILARQDDARSEALSRQNEFLSALPNAHDTVESLLKRAEANGANVRTQAAPAKKIVLYGWFGKENFGDDLLLSTAAAHFRKRFPESVILVIGGDADRVRGKFGFEAASPDQRYLTRSFLQGASLIAFFGGLIFDDPTELTAGDIETFMNPWIDPAGQAAVCLTAWLYGVPQMYLCAGMGPLSKPAAKHAARLIGLSGARFLLRDENSAQLARDAGIPAENIQVTTDMIMAAENIVGENAQTPLPDTVPECGYITVSLRTWPLNPNDFASNVATALDKAIETIGLAVLFVPFDTEDAKIHHAVHSRMKHADQAVCLEARPEPSQILGIVARSEMAFAMRLHCSILHHVAGKPAIGLNYNDKIAAHFASMDQTESLLELTASARQMADALVFAATHHESVGASVRENAAKLSGLATEAIEEAFRAVEEHEPLPEEPLVFHPRGVSKSEIDLAELREHIDRLSAENERLEERCREASQRALDLETSRSYRIGHALMRIPHRIKSLIS